MADKVNKIKPTQKMLAAWKEILQAEKESRFELSKYYAETNPEQDAIRAKLAKLKEDRELAAEAAIGYGLAIKNIDENFRNATEKLSKTKARIEQEKPQSFMASQAFKEEFGVDPYYVDWAALYDQGEDEQPRPSK